MHVLFYFRFVQQIRFIQYIERKNNWVLRIYHDSVRQLFTIYFTEHWNCAQMFTDDGGAFIGNAFILDQLNISNGLILGFPKFFW